jgi:hypothetical protein
VTGSSDHTAQVWDAFTCQPIGTALVHEKSVATVLFRPDDQAVLTLSMDQKVRLWEIRSGKQLIPALVQGEESPGSVWGSFSPDGKQILTAGYGLKARLWDAQTGRQIRLSLPNMSIFFEPKFSPDGSTVLTCVTPKTPRLQPTQELPDDVSRVANWLEVQTGLSLDERGQVQPMDNRGWQARRDRLESLGGSIELDPKWDYDLIHFGPLPLTRAKAWLSRSRNHDALRSFDDAVTARPLDRLLRERRKDFTLPGTSQ